MRYAYGARLLALTLGLLVLDGCAKHPLRPPKPLPVSTVQVQRGQLAVEVSTLGQALAPHSVTIVPQVTGILQSVAIHSGQQVQKGQLMFQIDPSTAQAAVDQDIANLRGEQAQERYDAGQVQAYKPLLNKDYVTRQTVQQAEAQAGSASASVAADRAALQAAQIALAQTQIHAPISGIVGILTIKSGNLVTANSTELTTIEQTHPMAVQFSLPEKYLAELQKAVRSGRGAVQIWDEDHRHQIDAGTVTAMDNTVNAASATITARATVPNVRGRLWPGEYVQVRFTAKTLHDVLVLPATALQQGVSGPFVYRVEKDHAVMVPVRFLGQNGNRIAIAAAHLLGATVIVGAPTRLHPGALVSAQAAP